MPQIYNIPSQSWFWRIEMSVSGSLHQVSLQLKNDDFSYLKKELNLIFDENEYVNPSWTFAPETVLKYDIRNNGDLNVGNIAPNTNIIEFNRNNGDIISNTCIYSYMKPDRPLILNFGSCTWLPFSRAHANDFETIYNKYKHYADFLTVYIKEAHALDDWMLYKIAEERQIYQHKNIKERIDSALKYIDESKTKCDIVVDTMNDNTMISYSSFPDRLYIIQNGYIIYKGGLGPDEYKPKEVGIFLDKYKRNKDRQRLIKKGLLGVFVCAVTALIRKNVNKQSLHVYN